MTQPDTNNTRKIGKSQKTVNAKTKIQEKGFNSKK